MKNLEWRMFESNFIDCPPWPDIGMPKEKFLKIFHLQWLVTKEKHQSFSIMDYYSGKDPYFPQKMMKYYWFEKKAPFPIKYFWAHHRFLMFLKR